MEKINTHDYSHLPILYSFRRCPYAMRARLALYTAKISHEHREVDLKINQESCSTFLQRELSLYWFCRKDRFSNKALIL